MVPVLHITVTDSAASTGPRSIERGVISTAFCGGSDAMASTGPRSIERGVHLNGSMPASLRGFNGAALN